MFPYSIAQNNHDEQQQEEEEMLVSLLMKEKNITTDENSEEEKEQKANIIMMKSVIKNYKKKMSKIQKLKRQLQLQQVIDEDAAESVLEFWVGKRHMFQKPPQSSSTIANTKKI